MFKILCAGGGSGGPVTPLLAIVEQLKQLKPDTQILFVGGKIGPEEKLVTQNGIEFRAITVAKLNRFSSWSNILMPIKLLWGFFQSVKIALSFKPDVVIGAGGYTQVPVMYASWLCGSLIYIHQQDVKPSLSNTLVLPIATKVTLTFPESQKDFPSIFTSHASGKYLVTGNPVRNEIERLSQQASKTKLEFDPNLPLVLIMGGGTGAAGINHLTDASLPELLKFTQVFHITGTGKALKFKGVGYRSAEFMRSMQVAYSASDIVVSRAGMSSISELSVMKKPSIVIPIPESHQEENARVLYEKKAALVLDQTTLTEEKFTREIKRLMFSGELAQRFSTNIDLLMPHDAASTIAKMILS